ncbi:hypothetical protein BDZ89DRAFT_1058845 [Hymenopellis radicata]|nr:hypothetical protein BDZ89DRAFT_1058845 [Hymenopellis radicata]
MRTKPGRLEQYHFTRAALQLDGCVVCAAEYFCSFMRLENVDLNRVVVFVNGRVVDEVLKEQLAFTLDLTTNEPLWRIVVVDERVVVFVWHHGIGDGMSGVAFHTNLRHALSLSSPSEMKSVVAVPSDLDLVPTIESTINVSTPFLTVIRELSHLFIPTSWTRGAKSWTGAPVGGNPSTAIDGRVVKFSGSELRQFHAICRSHKATVTSALYSVAVAALSDAIGTTKFKTLSANIPISLRALSKAPQEAFCVHISDYHLNPSISSSFSWDVASDRQGGRRVGLLKYLFGNYAAYFKSLLGKKRSATFALTNLGVFPSEEPSSGSWRVEDMWFAQSDVYTGAALGISVIGLSDGGLTLCLTSGPEVLGPGVLDVVAEKLSQIVRGIINESSRR